MVGESESGAVLSEEPSVRAGPSTPNVLSNDWDLGNDSDAREGSPSTGLEKKRALAPRLDDLFNFQLVVFQVEGTLFQVLRNGFNVPGTIFEAMFALPVGDAGSDVDNAGLEGSMLSNPIHLEGVCAKDFRAFLRILYPLCVVCSYQSSREWNCGILNAVLSIGPSSVVTTYEDWVGILELSTRWLFKGIREKAISALSTLMQQKPVPERIMLGRTYRVPDWLRNEYVSLAQKTGLQLDELRDPSAITLDWETIAKIMSVREQNTLTNLRNGRYSHQVSCYQCGTLYGWGTNIADCRCRLPAVVDTVFREEFEAMREDEVPLPSLPQSLEDDLIPGSANIKRLKKKKKGLSAM